MNGLLESAAVDGRTGAVGCGSASAAYTAFSESSIMNASVPGFARGVVTGSMWRRAIQRAFVSARRPRRPSTSWGSTAFSMPASADLYSAVVAKSWAFFVGWNNTTGSATSGLRAAQMQPHTRLMERRSFLGILGAAALAHTASRAATPAMRPAERDAPTIMTVRGPVPAEEIGWVLPHEHVLVDFIGAAEISRDRYSADAAFARIRPFLERVHALGCATLFECTPAYLGRDPRLLVRLSEATGMRLVTNTGYYTARQNKFLPAHALVEDADAIAARWRREWADGIEGTGVRPGFIKIGLDAGPLTEQGRKIVQAAARVHRSTGLTIAAHTGDHVAAAEQLAVLRKEGVKPEAWIWVHAQNAKDERTLIEAGQSGAWLGLDGVSPRSLSRHVQLVVTARQHGLLERVLISQDAGWYRPGEPDGGQFRDYEFLFRAFLPALREAGFGEREIQQLTVANPARAFAIRARLAE